MTGFVRRTPGLHAIAILVGVGFGVIGWLAVDPLVGAVTTSIESRLIGHLPPTAALNFFGNNWSVAIATSFGGVAFVIPALSSIAFNGLALGATAALEENLVALLAFVAPTESSKFPRFSSRSAGYPPRGSSRGGRSAVVCPARRSPTRLRTRSGY